LPYQSAKNSASVAATSRSAFHSSRVKNALWSPFAQSYDVTNLWLNPTS
jgi:hypothetical protein